VAGADLARDAENNKKGFYRYVSQKRKLKESVTPLILTRMATLYQQMRRRLRHSTIFLHQSSLAASLLAPPQLMNCRMGSRGAKSLTMYQKTRFRTT